MTVALRSADIISTANWEDVAEQKSRLRRKPHEFDIRTRI